MANEEYNNDYYDKLLREKEISRREQEEEEEDLDNDDQDELDESTEINQIDPKNKKNLNARKRLLSASIRKKIKKERFDGLTYYSALILALTKDLIDVLSLGSIGTIMAFIVNPLLTIILWRAGSSKAEGMLKRMVLINTFEFIPFVNILPWWTIMIIKMKIDRDNRIRTLERRLRKVNNF